MLFPPTKEVKRQSEATDPVTKYHDVLVLNPNRRLYHVPVNKQTGEFKQSVEEFDREKEAYRKVFKVAGEPLDPAHTDAGSKVSFGILPIKQEPNSSFVSCYLVNSLRLNPVNFWTEAEWNDHPDLRVLPLGVKEDLAVSRLLLATESGVVLDVRVNELKNTASVSPVDLRKNAEVWRLLRNGCVVGHTELNGETETQPLINLASFAKTEQPTTPPVSADAAGTWDFKWPAGKRLKVIVRPPGDGSAPSAGAEAAVRLVKELAQSWLVDTNLTLQFVDESDLDYDILVDMNPLPRTLVGGRTRDDQRISYPLSDLGSYAGRRRLGQATMYIGCAEGLKDEQRVAFNPEADDYFKSSVFKNMVLHEFGHAFGLPHLHQHPAWSQKQIFQSATDIARVVLSQLGVVMNEDFINEHFLLPWPGDPTKYSDWPDVTNLEPAAVAE